MSIWVNRAKPVAGLLAGSAVALMAGSTPAAAQVEREIVLNIMMECAKINDPTARLACYDNNIRSAGASVAASVPGRGPVPQGGTGPMANSSGAAGFGLPNTRSQPSPAPAPRPQPSIARGGQASSISPTVTAIADRGPGLYLVTMEDGAQWEFAEGVPLSYRAPRRGETVEIERGTLGSFLLRYDGQQPVAVRRLR